MRYGGSARPEPLVRTLWRLDGVTTSTVRRPDGVWHDEEQSADCSARDVNHLGFIREFIGPRERGCFIVKLLSVRTLGEERVEGVAIALLVLVELGEHLQDVTVLPDIFEVGLAGVKNNVDSDRRQGCCRFVLNPLGTDKGGGGNSRAVFSHCVLLVQFGLAGIRHQQGPLVSTGIVLRMIYCADNGAILVDNVANSRLALGFSLVSFFSLYKKSTEEKKETKVEASSYYCHHYYRRRW
jgi:hypothetical protein